LVVARRGVAGVGRGEEDEAVAASCERRREEEDGIGSCSIELASELASDDDEGVASPLSPPPWVVRTLLVEYRSLDETAGRATSIPAATGGVVAPAFATW
jgi:hypothetical protein